MFTDNQIESIQKIIKSKKFISSDYDSSVKWERLKRSDMVLEKTMSVELGAPDKKSLSVVGYTDTNGIMDKDEIIIVGNELKKYKGKSVSFSKLVFIETEKIDAHNEYEKISDLLDCKYRVNLKGYMIRAVDSAKSEWVRISKDSIKKGFSFNVLGNELISEYKKLDYVKHVQVIFVVDDAEMIEKLRKPSSVIERGIRALNTKYDDIEYNCSECELEDICDEIDGMNMHG